MQSCPKCGSSEVKISDGALWTLHCTACGFRTAGTASFPHPIEVEKDYRVVFQVSAARQISTVRSIASELSKSSTAEVLEAARKGGMKLSVSSLPMWRAREYVQKAEAAGINAEIQDDERA